MHNKIIDFDDELGSIEDTAKQGYSIAKKSGAMDQATANLPPEAKQAIALFKGLASGNTKDTITGLGSAGGTVLGSVFLGPVGGAIGGMLGGLLGGLVPRTQKEIRQDREARNIQHDLDVMSKIPVTDSNIVRLLESGKVVISTYRHKTGDGTYFDDPGSSNQWKMFIFKNGKLAPISKEASYKLQEKGYSNPASGYMFLKSNAISRKFMLAYQGVKDGLAAEIIEKKESNRNLKKNLNNVIVKALSNSGIKKELKRVIAKEASNSSKLDRYARLLNEADKRAGKRLSAHDKKERKAQITLAKLITKGAVLSKDNNQALASLKKKIGNQSLVPNKYDSVLGGKGLMDLLKKHG